MRRRSIRGRSRAGSAGRLPPGTARRCCRCRRGAGRCRMRRSGRGSRHRRRSALALVTWSAPWVRAYFTWSGVSVGNACRRSATAPDTTAAAWLVPLPRNSRPVTSPDTRPCGLFWSIVEPGSRSDTTEVPGATRSTCRPVDSSENEAGLGVVVRPPVDAVAAVGRTDRDHVRVVGRVGEAVAGRATVAARGDDDDAVVPRVLSGRGKRVDACSPGSSRCRRTG